MDELIRYGFSIEEIQNMMDNNMMINSIKDTDVSSLLKLLESIGCSRSQIKNISITNPFYFSQNISSIEELLMILKEMGFSSLPILLDENPYLLNLSHEDLLQIVKKMRKDGIQEVEILDKIQKEILV